MAEIRGSLMVTAESMEISHVVPENQDVNVREFYRLRTEAERWHDRFYALPELYTHNFSYGDFYTGFLYRSWPDFHSDRALMHITQNTHQLIQGFAQCPMLRTIASEDEFEGLEKPHAHTGYCNPQGFEDFVNNVDVWEEWHRKWNVIHPESIDWSRSSNNWFSRPDLILMILKRELLAKFKETKTPEESQELLEKITDNNVVHEFHRLVMGRQGDAIGGYASSIGGEICRCNYYTYEAELSDFERQYAKNPREIYSIINRNGKRQFISIDFHHGMFEFHDETGAHLGEYRFDGSFNSNAEADHSLKCMEQWHRQTGKH